MTNWSEAETKALALRAARGAGLPPAQAELYAAAAIHLLQTDTGAETLAAALGTPTQTTATLTAILCLPPGPFDLPPSALTIAALQALPGTVTLTSSAQGQYDPDTPNASDKPARLTISNTLKNRWEEEAHKTYVPDTAMSRAGAGAAETD